VPDAGAIGELQPVPKATRMTIRLKVRVLIT
jgi:hypothetical protein